MSARAKTLIGITILAGVALLAVYFGGLPWATALSLVASGQWAAVLEAAFPWLAVGALASVAQVLKVEGATNRTSYNAGWLFYGFAFLLLGARAALFVIVVAHLVEWAWHKYPWYIQSFNIASFAIAILWADSVYRLVNPSMQTATLQATVALLLALAAFTLTNHVMVGLVIWMARGQNLMQSGVFDVLSLLIDYTLISLGAAGGILWMVNPSAVLLTVAPLYLIYSALEMPSLERKAETDPKTGLYNAPYFTDAFEKELQRAERYDRPVTVVLGDLDLLRNINNTYGHLAGDMVLTGIARILQEQFKSGETVARFGGEEFAILIPETTPQAAYESVERARAIIAATEFPVTTSVTPIQVTMSFGIAGREASGQTTTEITHNADVALYSAKLSGRNKVIIYSDQDINGLFRRPKPPSAGEDPGFPEHEDPLASAVKLTGPTRHVAPPPVPHQGQTLHIPATAGPKTPAAPAETRRAR